MSINTALLVMFLIYMITQFFMALGILFKYKKKLIITEKNDLLRDIFASIVFYILGLFVYLDNPVKWTLKTPLLVIIILLIFGIFQMQRKKIKINLEEGVGSLCFIKYSYFLSRFSGMLLIGSAVFCSYINIL